VKQRISATIDEEKIQKIEGILSEGIFRSRSHVLEFALSKFLLEVKK